MKKQMRALEELLAGHMQNFLNQAQSSPEWKGVGWVSENIAELMATAAMTVIRGQSDVQDYLKDEGYLE